jgi:predicted small integral membrane protein
MILRIAKMLLVLAVALFYSIVVFNNLTDYNSNYLFVYHVLQMDSTFPGNQGMWRAVHSTFVYRSFYGSIISWESLTAALAWIGGGMLLRKLRAPAAAFNLAKRISVAALALGLLMWFVAFLTIGAEWFLMWQSKTWNGQEAAFRMFTVLGIVLIFVAMPDVEEQA